MVGRRATSTPMRGALKRPRVSVGRSGSSVSKTPRYAKLVRQSPGPSSAASQESVVDICSSSEDEDSAARSVKQRPSGPFWSEQFFRDLPGGPKESTTAKSRAPREPPRVAKVRTRVPRTAVVVVTEPTPVLVVAKERKNELTTALQNGGSMVVVLSGPPGCGKSVLLHTVCDELGLSVTEYRSKAWVRGYEERHALVRFLRTPLPLSVKLIRESVLDLMSTRQSAYSGSVSEREVLESLISARGRVAISTTNYRLLDKLRQTVPSERLRVLTFRPISVTGIRKILRAKISAMSSAKTPPGLIDTLATESRGDARFALNQLEAALAGGSVTASSGGGGGSKDNTFDYFHALGKVTALLMGVGDVDGQRSAFTFLGKREFRYYSAGVVYDLSSRATRQSVSDQVLYCKRIDPDAPDRPPAQLPSEKLLPKLDRLPPYFDVEDLCCMPDWENSDTVVNLLHENYIDFYGDIGDAAECMSRLASVDAYRNSAYRPWRSAHSVDSSVGMYFLSSWACRAVMDSNCHPVAPSKGRLHQFRAERKTEDREQKSFLVHLNYLLSGTCRSPALAATMMVPFTDLCLRSTRGEWPRLSGKALDMVHSLAADGSSTSTWRAYKDDPIESPSAVDDFNLDPISENFDEAPPAQSQMNIMEDNEWDDLTEEDLRLLEAAVDLPSG